MIGYTEETRTRSTESLWAAINAVAVLRSERGSGGEGFVLGDAEARSMLTLWHLGPCDGDAGVSRLALAMVEAEAEEMLEDGRLDAAPGFVEGVRSAVGQFAAVVREECFVDRPTP